MSGIICCICNHKGGVGKTTLTCNLGTALALKNKKVLVIDNDPQSNTTGILVSAETNIRNSLYELLDPQNSNPPPPENCIYVSKHKGLHCLPNVEETSGLEMDFAARYPKSLKYLSNKIRDFGKKNYDYILIDCPPTLSLFVANALYASDCCIVPIDAGSAYSLDGLRKILEMIDSVQSSDDGNPSLKFLRLLINRVDMRTSVSQVIIGDVKERFGNGKVFNQTIPINTSFQQAEYVKQTIFENTPTSRGAKAYRKLADELLNIFKHDEV